MKRRAASLAFVPALLLLGGCQLVQKGSYWDDMKRDAARDTTDALLGTGVGGEDDPRDQGPWLGVRVNRAEDRFQLGVRLVHVFGSSPAARAGLEAGDELRKINRVPVRSPEQIRAVLSNLGPHEHVSLVYVRDGAQREVKCALVPVSLYKKERRRRVFAEASYGGMSFPFFFEYQTRELKPEFLKNYYGVTVDDPLLVYQDLDIFPLWKTAIGPFRRESIDVYDSSRTRFLFWPLQVTTGRQDLTGDLHGLIPEPPIDAVDL